MDCIVAIVPPQHHDQQRHHRIPIVMIIVIVIMQEHMVALVIPAFETREYRPQLPTTKTQLLDMMSDGEITPFRQHEWPVGHAPTDYVRWSKAVKPYYVDWEPGVLGCMHGS